MALTSWNDKSDGKRGGRGGAEGGLKFVLLYG